MRCTCQQAVIESLEEMAKWCDKQRLAWVREARYGHDKNLAYAKASSYSSAASRIRLEIEMVRE